MEVARNSVVGFAVAVAKSALIVVEASSAVVIVAEAADAGFVEVVAEFGRTAVEMHARVVEAAHAVLAVAGMGRLASGSGNSRTMLDQWEHLAAMGYTVLAVAKDVAGMRPVFGVAESLTSPEIQRMWCLKLAVVVEAGS